MRFGLGLAIGLVVGALAMYLGLRQPWRGAPAAATVATAEPAGSGSGSGSGKKAKKAKGRRSGGGDPGRSDDGGGAADDAGFETEETEPIVLTAADRKLEWRGDEVSVPARTFDMADGKESRPLDDGEIGGAISRRGSGVIDCIVRGATGTDLVATVTLKMVVGGDGKVGKLKVQAPHYLFEQGLLACAKRAAGKLDFPATGAPTLVTAPFELGR